MLFEAKVAIWAVAHARFFFTEGQSRGVPCGNTRLSDHVAFGLVYPLSSIVPLYSCVDHAMAAFGIGCISCLVYVPITHS